MSPNGGLEPPLPRGHLQMGISFHLSKGDLSWGHPKKGHLQMWESSFHLYMGIFFSMRDLPPPLQGHPQEMRGPLEKNNLLTGFLQKGRFLLPLQGRRSQGGTPL